MASDNASVHSTGPNTCQKTTHLSLKDPESDLASTSLSTFSSTIAVHFTIYFIVCFIICLVIDITICFIIYFIWNIARTFVGAARFESLATGPKCGANSPGGSSEMLPIPHQSPESTCLRYSTWNVADPSLVLPGLNPLPRLRMCHHPWELNLDIADPSLVPDLNPSPPVQNCLPSVETQSGTSQILRWVRFESLPPSPKCVAVCGNSTGTSPESSLVPD
ncbi:hypothetical protein BS47DRAFT_1401722 [Hydnum rufescens UP504]|uniref:Uncharacterized protein n=1 Tax=Hydnum rufescens UP504 TaxID=1448309 RepID=A0A9P6DMD0_9AGAM|nr:hypothetical protein BS47DRAFT_1401722 [Hydnum rufescens UP504]